MLKFLAYLLAVPTFSALCISFIFDLAIGYQTNICLTEKVLNLVEPLYGNEVVDEDRYE